MPVLVLFLCLIGNYFTYHSKGDLVQVKEEIYSPVVEYYEGVEVSNSGLIENVYFNINMSIDDVEKIFEDNKNNAENLYGDNWALCEDGIGFVILSSENHRLVFAYSESFNIYMIMDLIALDIIFINNDINDFGFVGWNLDLLGENGSYSINEEVSKSFSVSSLDGSNINHIIYSGDFNFLFSIFFSSQPIEIIKQGGELLRTEINYLTFEEWFGEHYTLPAKKIEGQYLDNISINTDIVESDLLNYFSTLTFDEDRFSILFTCDDFSIAVYDILGESNPEAMLLLYVSAITGDMYCLYISNLFYSDLSRYPQNEIFSTFLVLNAGWNHSNYFDLPINSDNYTFNESINELPLLWVPPVYVDTLNAEKLSFFDITLLQTDNTFIKFQLPFLRNSFESVFNILNFESSYVSSFVLTSFTWMIQLLLLHVVVDTLSFIFKMYHKLMDKVV